jgi:hypothetical protein
MYSDEYDVCDQFCYQEFCDQICDQSCKFFSLTAAGHTSFSTRKLFIVYGRQGKLDNCLCSTSLRTYLRAAIAIKSRLGLEFPFEV